MTTSPETECKTRLTSIRTRLEFFERSLPRELDPLALSKAKTPYKALSYRETLIWRITELGRDAYHCYERGHLSSAICLTRAAVETAAAMWHLLRRVERCLHDSELGDFDEHVMKMLLGSRTNPDAPQALNVLKFVDTVEKEIPSFRRQYEEFSEFAHPNWAGTTGLYTKDNFDELMTYFGRGLDEEPYPLVVGTVNLDVALLMFEHSYTKLGTCTPEFVKLCERCSQSVGLEVSTLLPVRSRPAMATARSRSELGGAISSSCDSRRMAMQPRRIHGVSRGCRAPPSSDGRAPAPRQASPSIGVTFTDPRGEPVREIRWDEPIHRSHVGAAEPRHVAARAQEDPPPPFADELRVHRQRFR